MSAPSTHDTNELGGGWFEAPGLDVADPLRGSQQPQAPSQALRDATTKGRTGEAYWDDVAKGQRPSSRRPRNLVGAGVGRRFLANFVDNIVVWLLSLPIFALVIAEMPWIAVQNPAVPNLEAVAAVTLFATVTSLTYFIGSESLFGATIGKALFGLRVVSRLGQRPTIGESLIRNVWRILSSVAVVLSQVIPEYRSLGAFAACGLAFSIGVTAAGSLKGQGWHDRLAACFVINKR